ncbi:MAG: HAMP domain-containing histidine kinase, partial [Nitrosopumilus sp.]|nr:HAMP domain-containing histidine kinase [Nitrosopumilus sp.]
DGFIGVDGNYRIAITHPIILNNSKEGYVGLVGVVMPTIKFFQHYGNIYDIKSQYLAVLDQKSVHLVHPLPSLVGKPFFGNESQKITSQNEILNHLVKTVMTAGKPFSAIYKFQNGERLSSGYPLIIQESPTYFLFVITPTSSIYAEINDVISTERLQMFSLISGFTGAIMILIIFLIRWNNVLDKEVKIRTKELEESNKLISMTNKKLETVNEQLKNQDRMQKEFINIAAHELRTPIQPILGLSKIIKGKTKDKEQKGLLDIIIKNTQKLKNLSEDILDITKIESDSFYLNKESINLNELIKIIVEEFQNHSDPNKKIKIEYHDNKINPIFVRADKNRISQVLSNLISNSIKFIPREGTIYIKIEKRKIEDIDKKEISLIRIKDTGVGIDSEIFPKLFTKFTTKSFQGTGLGLYICKKIIESHGGRIWAEKNDNEMGATFLFYLPLEN